MPGLDQGRNGGITGLADFPGKAASFEFTASAWDQAVDAALFDAAGRGDGDFPETWFQTATGRLAISGKVRLDGWPMPDGWKGEVGTVLVQLDAGALQTLSVRVVGQTFKQNEKTQGIWDVSLVCQILDAPAFSGFGGGNAQPAAGDEQHADKQTWEGLAKTRDPKSLADGATQRFAVWGLPDNDQAETDKLTTFVTQTAVPPVPGLKLRPVSLQRLSKRVCVLSVQWLRTDTYDDAMLPLRRKTLDPLHLASEATVSEINGTPAAPTGDNFVKRTSQTYKLHDAAAVTLDTYGRRSTQADVEYPGSVTTTDPNGVASTRAICVVTGNATPPATPDPGTPYVYRTVASERLNIDQWRHTFEYGLRDTKGEIEQDGSVNDVDPKGLKDAARLTKFTTSATAPTVPASPLAGLVHRGTTSQQVNDGHWKHTFDYGQNTSQDEIEFDGTSTTYDDSRLGDKASITVVNADPAADEFAPVLNGYLFREVTTQQLTDGSGKYKHRYEYGLNSNTDDVVLPGTRYDNDPSDLVDEVEIALQNSSATPPATPTPPWDLKLAKTSSRQLTDTVTSGQWLHTFTFRRKTEQDSLELDGTETRQDPDDFGETGEITQVNGSATPPSAPAAPVGQLVSTDTKPVTAANGAYTGRWQHTFRYAATTRKQEMEFEGDAETDASSLDDSDTQTVTSATSTPPTTPAPRVADLKFTRRTSRRFQGTPEKWRHTFTFRRNSEQDKVELAGTNTTDALDDFGESARITRLTGGATPPTAPPAPVGQLIEVESKPQTAPNGAYTGRWAHTFVYGPTTGTQTKEFEGTSSETDASSLNDRDAQTIVTTTSTPPTTPTPAIADLQLVRRVSRREQGTPAKWTHRFEFARNTPEQEIELKGTVTRDDQSDLDESAEVTKVTNSGTPPTTPAAPLGTLDEVESKPQTAPNGAYTGRWAHTFKYASTTRLQRAQFEDASIEDDPQELSDQDVQALVSDTSTPPADPATRIVGLKVVRRVSTRIGGTPEKWRHRFYYGWLDSKDKIEFESTAKGDPLEAPTAGETIAVKDWPNGGTLASVFAGEYAAAEATLSFGGLSVTRRATNKYELRTIAANDDKTVRVFHGRAGWEPRPSDGVNVTVKIVKTVGTSLRWARVGQTWRFVSHALLRLRRRYLLPANSAGNTTLDNLLHWSLVGVVGSNNSFFLGLPGFKVAFAGSDLIGHFQSGNQRVAVVDHYYEYDSLGHHNDSAVELGGIYTTGTPTVGPNNALAAFGWLIVPPTQIDLYGTFMS